MMNAKYSHEFNWWQKILQKTLGMWRINEDSIDFKWGYFAPQFGFKFVVNRGGYFDNRYSLLICFIWGVICINLPFRTKLSPGCEMPRYGIAIHGDSFWLYAGGIYDESIEQVTRNRTMNWSIPYFSYQFEGHWILDVEANWRKIEKGESSWKIKEKYAYKETHPYTYELRNGETQHRSATCTLEKRIWHRKWFPFLKMKRKSLGIEFNEEVGELSGSWKGGVTGCSYDMKEKETMLQCLRRMEQMEMFT